MDAQYSYLMMTFDGDSVTIYKENLLSTKCPPNLNPAVEVSLNTTDVYDQDSKIREAVHCFLKTISILKKQGTLYTPEDICSRVGVEDLSFVLSVVDYIKSVRICELYNCPSDLDISNFRDQVNWNMFLYQSFSDYGDSVSTSNYPHEEGTVMYTQTKLPHSQFEGLWESLIFDTDIKQKLCSYISQGIYLSTMKVDPNIITWNKLILLHGPPGSGKTQLSKALAHKISIRLQRLRGLSKLVEINANALFSKWFSESGKIITDAFANIRKDLDEGLFVFVIIDEVESLAAARSAAIQRNEPSDALRAVNVLLTQIDQIRSYDNVLVLATSNLTAAIDAAFLDRADIVQYVGLPAESSRYAILKSCIEELQARDITLRKIPILPFEMLDPSRLPQATEENSKEYVTIESSLKLLSIARKCAGLSGRALRKLPLAALTKLPGVSKYSLLDILQAFEIAIEDFTNKINKEI